VNSKSKVQFGRKNNEEDLNETNESDDEDEDDDEDDDVPPLYFTSPQQLLDIFAELEENNLALIKNCQETEETLEELKGKIHDTEKRMDQETESLKQQIEFLRFAISREEEKAKQLEERAR
jgi:predicted transcriptional regulator